jgi:CheY-like chemotaxis protein
MSTNEHSHARHSAIMLVEDDTRARKAVATLLRGIGHTVRAYSTAEEAAEALACFCPDVAILDVRLHGMFGNELARLLKKLCPETQIIFLTAETEVACMFPDFVVLPKPLDPPRLLNQLSQSALSLSSPRPARHCLIAWPSRGACPTAWVS